MARRKKTKSTRGYPYAGQRGVKDGRWTRDYHEDFAIEAMNSASKEISWQKAGIPTRHPGVGQCAPSTAYAVIRANRDIARARVHLSALGPADSKRTRKLWAAIGAVEKRVNEAGNYVAKCVGLSGLSGQRKRRGR